MELKKIFAVAVNHNTSKYTELLISSLLTNRESFEMSTTVYDNQSIDDGVEDLKLLLKRKNIPFIQTGFDTKSIYNPDSFLHLKCSHGEIFTKFVLENPECDYYLFLDSDVCFIDNKTIEEMVKEIQQSEENCFAIAARQSWDGINEISEEEQKKFEGRIHPCCALVKNTPIFRSVVKEVGLSGVTYHYGKNLVFTDTFGLMTQVMKTHGLDFQKSSKLIIHFSHVSYNSDHIEAKEKFRDELLRKYVDLLATA